jgi:hypothetical protein
MRVEQLLFLIDFSADLLQVRFGIPKVVSFSWLLMFMADVYPEDRGSLLLRN